MKTGAQFVGAALSPERTLELAGAEKLDCSILDVRSSDGPIFPAVRMLLDRSFGVVFYTSDAGLEGLKRDWSAAQVLMKPAPDGMLISAIVAACLSSETRRISSTLPWHTASLCALAM